MKIKLAKRMISIKSLNIIAFMLTVGFFFIEDVLS